MNRRFFLVCMLTCSGVIAACYAQSRSNTQQGSFKANTIVSIKGEEFYINGQPTYKGRFWKGKKIQGLLFNSRMVQGIFDDLNPATRVLFKYPDSTDYDANRNTSEFVTAMDSWRSHGLLAFTLNLQGGSPTGYGNKGWINSAFDKKGELRQDYFHRLEKIIDKADRIGMVVILGYFYFGQDEYLENETAVINAVDKTTGWLLDRGYKNVLIELNNECDLSTYDHGILKADKVHQLIERVRKTQRNGYSLLAGTSYSGGFVPLPNVVKSSDFILLHGNGVSQPSRISEMVTQTRNVEGYHPMPILFNEDDHYDFEKNSNNMVAAVNSYASWGLFDYRRKGESFNEGFQSVPVDWRISSKRKEAFFKKLQEITSGK